MDPAEIQNFIRYHLERGPGPLNIIENSDDEPLLEELEEDSESG